MYRFQDLSKQERHKSSKWVSENAKMESQNDFSEREEAGETHFESSYSSDTSMELRGNVKNHKRKRLREQLTRETSSALIRTNSFLL